MAIDSISSRHVYVAATLGAIVVGLGLLRLTPQVCGVYHDDGVYVSTAKALAEGHGYTLISLPSSPPQTKYPPLYPLILAAAWKLWPAFPANLVLLQSISVLSAAAAVGLGYLYLVRFRHADSRSCVLAGALCATSPSYVYFATQTLSEAMFSLLIVGALWALDAAHRSEKTVVRSFAGGIVSTLPFLCRSVGICLQPAGLFVFRSGLKNALAFGLGTLIVAGPWVAWIVANTTQRTEPGFDYYTVNNYLSWWSEDSSPFRVPLLNLLWLFTYLGALPIEGLYTRRVPFLVFTLLGVGVALQLFRSRRRSRVIWVFSLTYAAVVVFWTWPPARFLGPLLPVLSVFLVSLVRSTARRLCPVRASHCALAIIGAVIFTNLVQQVRFAILVRETGYPYSILAEAPAKWSDYVQMFEWIKGNVDRDAVIGSGLDTMVYLYTLRPGVRPYVLRPSGMYYMSAEPPIGTADEFRSNLISYGVEYVVMLPMPGFAEERPLEQRIDEMLRQRPGCLVERYRVPTDSRFVIYAVDRPWCSDR